MAMVYNSQLDALSLYHEHHDRFSASTSSSIGPALPALGHALAGSVGTAISNVAIYPLDLIITRLQVQRTLRSSSNDSTPDTEYQGVIDGLEKVYMNEGGVKAFYVGVLQDTGKSIVDSFLFFLFYNYLRTKRLQKNGSGAKILPPLEELLVGAFAGACSKFFTAPISNIVTRKQTASMSQSRNSTPHKEPTVADIFNDIKATKGYRGLWSGYSASLVLTLNPSLTFFLYEFFKRTTLPKSKRDNPGARTTFLMAAFAKACASTVTYPFSLAKARAQAESKPPVDTSTSKDAETDVERIISPETTANEKKQSTKQAATKARNAARRNNVFTEILKIYRTEGAAALYEGVHGEILKGFFSHGITMLVKESIHKLIIQAYFVILKALNRFPTPGELAAQAQTKANQGLENVRDVVESGIERTREVATETTGQAQSMVQSGYAKFSEVIEDAKERIESIGERADTLNTNATTIVQNVVEKGQKAANAGYQNVQEGAQNVTEAVKERVGGLVNSGQGNTSASGAKRVTTDETIEKAGKVIGIEELKSEDAGHLLGNAQEMLGDRGLKIVDSVKRNNDGGKS